MTRPVTSVLKPSRRMRIPSRVLNKPLPINSKPKLSSTAAIDLRVVIITKYSSRVFARLTYSDRLCPQKYRPAYVKVGSLVVIKQLNAV